MSTVRTHCLARPVRADHGMAAHVRADELAEHRGRLVTGQCHDLNTPRWRWRVGSADTTGPVLPQLLSASAAAVPTDRRRQAVFWGRSSSSEVRQDRASRLCTEPVGTSEADGSFTGPRAAIRVTGRRPNHKGTRKPAFHESRIPSTRARHAATSLRAAGVSLARWAAMAAARSRRARSKSTRRRSGASTAVIALMTSSSPPTAGTDASTPVDVRRRDVGVRGRGGRRARGHAQRFTRRFHRSASTAGGQSQVKVTIRTRLLRPSLGAAQTTHTHGEPTEPGAVPSTARGWTSPGTAARASADWVSRAG